LLLYSAGFIRNELKFGDYDQRLMAVEEVIPKLKENNGALTKASNEAATRKRPHDSEEEESGISLEVEFEKKGEEAVTKRSHEKTFLKGPRAVTVGKRRRKDQDVDTSGKLEVVISC